MNEKSSIKIVSNIILKSLYDKNHYGYLPYDVLPESNKDLRRENELSIYQEKQKMKKMFWTENVVDED